MLVICANNCPSADSINNIRRALNSSRTIHICPKRRYALLNNGVHPVVHRRIIGWTTQLLCGFQAVQLGHRSGLYEITLHLKLTFSRLQWPRSKFHGPLNWFECYLLLFLISFNLRLSGLLNPFATSLLFGAEDNKSDKTQ